MTTLKERKHQYYLRHKKEINDKAKLKYQENKEEYIKRITKYRQTEQGKQKRKEWCQKNKDKINNQRKEQRNNWRQNNKEKINKYKRDYRKSHPEKIKIRDKKEYLQRKKAIAKLSLNTIKSKVSELIRL